MTLKSNHYIWFSLIAHVGVVAYFGLQFGQALQTFKLGNSNANSIIHSYVESDKLLLRKNPITQSIKSTDKEAIKLKLKQESSTTEKKAISKVRGKNANQWLVMLHQKIKTSQRYPVGAKKMHQEGRVTVQFDMLPSGQIKNLRVAKSSNYTLLDHAALMSVNRAAPFIGASKIQGNKIKTYQVDVVFKLS